MSQESIRGEDMGIDDYKVKSEDFNNKDIMGLPDRPSEAGFSAEQLKACLLYTSPSPRDRG